MVAGGRMKTPITGDVSRSLPGSHGRGAFTLRFGYSSLAIWSWLQIREQSSLLGYDMGHARSARLDHELKPSLPSLRRDDLLVAPGWTQQRLHIVIG